MGCVRHIELCINLQVFSLIKPSGVANQCSSKLSAHTLKGQDIEPDLSRSLYFEVKTGSLERGLSELLK